MALGLFKKKNVSADAVVADIEQQIATAQKTLPIAQKNHEEAALAATIDVSDATRKQADIAADALDMTHKELARLGAALVAAREMVEEETIFNADQDNKASWKKANILAAKRQKLGIEIEVALVNLAAQIRELADLSAELHAVAPAPKVKLVHSPLSSPNLELAVRLQLRRLGFLWPAQWTGNVEDIPTFSQNVEKGNFCILDRQKIEEAA